MKGTVFFGATGPVNLSLTGDCGSLQFASLPRLRAPDQLQLDVLRSWSNLQNVILEYGSYLLFD